MKVANLDFKKYYDADNVHLSECIILTQNNCIVSIFKDESTKEKRYTCAFSMPNSKATNFDPTNSIRNIGGISQIYLSEELMDELIGEIEKL